ncbi:MAG: FecR family protein [Rhodothermaceae bacterium]
MDEKFYILAAKLLTNEISAEEKSEFDKFLGEDKYKNEFQLIKQQYDLSGKERDESLFNRLCCQSILNEKIETDDEQFGTARKVSNFRKRKYIWAAASVIFIMLIATGILTKITNQTNFSDFDEMISSKTIAGQKIKLRLNEGTNVVINAASELKYSKDFGIKNRIVYLSGEAYFEVKSNKKLPFIVRTGDIQTKVLGTVFNVKSFPDENNIEVSLLEGKVEVSDENFPLSKKVVLYPDEIVYFDKKEKTMELGKFTPLTTTGWKDNNFIFKNEKLGNILKVLGRNFGIKFTLTDHSFSEYKITTNFNKDSFRTILKVISNLTGLDYKVYGEKNIEVIFYNNK